MKLRIEVVNVPEAQPRSTALAEGENLSMPLLQTAWISSFGMVVDRFGVPWMVNVKAPAI